MSCSHACSRRLLARYAILPTVLVCLAAAAQGQTKPCSLLNPCSTSKPKLPTLPTVKPNPPVPQPIPSQKMPDIHPPHPDLTGTEPIKPNGAPPRPTPGPETRTSDGSYIRRGADGRVRDVHDARRGINIHDGLGGGRTVSVQRADEARVVAYRGGSGYVQRPYLYRKHEFARRTYYERGHYHDRYYRTYLYHGVPLYAYAPALYYPPAFYGWAYYPWPAPVIYTDWGWAGSPWYGVYGASFAPFAAYAGPAYWLTDYVIAASLQEAYAAQVEAQIAAAANPYGPPVSSDVKQMILNEVKQELGLENAEAQQSAQGQDIDPASSGIDRMLADGQPHVFVAGSDLDLVTDSGQECPVSEGDVLEVVQPPADNATTATATVLFAKGVNECPKGVSVAVQLADLQEMQNHMRETIDRGLGEMKAKAGSDGIPAVPAPAQEAPAKPAFAAIPPPPDPNVAAEIKDADAQAGQAEQDVSAAAGASGGPSTPADPVPTQPASLAQRPATGQTKEQVTAILGEPTRVQPINSMMEMDFYANFNVVFMQGKVVVVFPLAQ